MSSITQTQPNTDELMALLVDQSYIIITLTSLLKIHDTDKPTQFNCNQQTLQPTIMTLPDHEHTIKQLQTQITQLQTQITQMELQHTEERRLATYRLNELIEVKAQLLEETEERQFLQQKLNSSTINLQQRGRHVPLVQHNY